MKNYRTIGLLLLVAFCGIGSAMIITFYQSLAGAILFIAFPYLVVALFLSILYDVRRAGMAEAASRSRTRAADAGTGQTTHSRAA
jgi:hypothetical protein